MHAIDVVYNYDIPTEYYLCDACDFVGILSEGIQHVVENQFNVVEPKHDSSNLKLGRTSNIDQFFRKL